MTKPDDLTPRAGKVLRYVAACTQHGTAPIKPEQTVNYIRWSDLPHSKMQAVSVLSGLRRRGLVEKVKHGYNATAEGIELIALADKQRRWMTAPIPAVTNQYRRKQ